MTGSDLVAIRESLGLAQHELASILGRNVYTIGGWERGRGTMPAYTAALVRAFAASSTRGDELRGVLQSEGPVRALAALLSRAA